MTACFTGAGRRAATAREDLPLPRLAFSSPAVSAAPASDRPWRAGGRGPAVAVGAAQALALARRGATTLWQAFLRGLVWSSAWAAGAIASLSLFAQQALGLEAGLLAPAILFVSALFIYNLDHVIDARVQQPDDDATQAYYRHPGLVVLTGLAGLATLGLLALAPPAAALVFLGYATIGVLYGLPIFPGSAGGPARRLKDLPMSKGLLVGTAIAWGTVGTAVACSSRAIDAPLLSAAIFTAAFVFVFVSSNTHVSDIPDLSSDLRAGVRTLPATLGLRQTCRTLVLVNLVLLALMLGGWGATATGLQAEMIISLCGSVLYILSVDTETRREVFAVVVDGTLFVPALLVALRDVLP